MDDDDLYDGYNDYNSAFNTDVNKFFFMFEKLFSN